MEHLDIITLLLRAITGVLFFFQGYDKIFNVKVVNVVRAFSEPRNGFSLPQPIMIFLVTISSYAEMIGGLFLFLGLFKIVALYVLSIDLVFVALSFSMIKAMWDMQHFFPRFVFVLLLWAIPFSNDVYSLDRLFF